MADLTPQQQAVADIKANSTRYITTSIRGTFGGYVITGQVQYNDKVTKGVMMTENAEGVATTPQQAHQMSLNYFTAGNFDGVVEAAPAATPQAATADAANMFGNTGGGTI